MSHAYTIQYIEIYFASHRRSTSLEFLEAKFRNPQFRGLLRTSALNIGSPYRRRMTNNPRYSLMEAAYGLSIGTGTFKRTETPQCLQ